jgi:hypothetical protein
MLPKVLNDFENDARTQVRFHLIMAWFWLGGMVATLFIPTFHGQMAALLIMEVSLYANFSTEFGALAAAQASLKADK